MTYFLLLNLGFFFAALTNLPAAQVTPNNDALEVFRGRQGPYEIAVSVQPEQPTVGTVHFSVTLLDAETSQPIQDAQVVVVAIAPQGEPRYGSPALNSPAVPSSYIGNITFYSPGQWNVEVRVQTAAQGEAEVSFPLDIAPQATPPAIEGVFVLVLIIAALVGGAAYVWYSARRQRRASAANR